MPTIRIALLLLLLGASVLSGAPILATSVSVPNGNTVPPINSGTSTTTIQGNDDQVYSASFGLLAIATAQSDYGVLRNYVYSNIGTAIAGFQSHATTFFSDGLTVNSTGAGNLIIQVLVEGEITGTATPDTGLNSLSFLSQWGLQNITLGPIAHCLHSNNTPGAGPLAINCDLVVPVAAGLNTISFNGALNINVIGRASAVEMDFFNTSKVVSLGVFDTTGAPLSALITADSGTTYPTGSSEVPEPGTAFLCGSSLAGAYFIRRFIRVLKKKQ